MSDAKFVTDADIGDGLEIVSGKLQVSQSGSPDPSGFVTHTGDFVDASIRSGWIFPRTDLFTASTGMITDDWVQLPGSEVSPNCVNDITINGNIGRSVIRAKNMWVRVIYSVRLLLDGVETITYLDHSTHNFDAREGILLRQSAPMSVNTFHFSRASVPALSTITVEAQRRYIFTIGSQALSDSSGDHIGGLRGHYNATYIPETLVGVE